MDTPSDTIDVGGLLGQFIGAAKDSYIAFERTQAAPYTAAAQAQAAQSATLLGMTMSQDKFQMVVIMMVFAVVAALVANRGGR